MSSKAEKHAKFARSNNWGRNLNVHQLLHKLKFVLIKNPSFSNHLTLDLTKMEHFGTYQKIEDQFQIFPKYPLQVNTIFVENTDAKVFRCNMTFRTDLKSLRTGKIKYFCGCELQISSEKSSEKYHKKFYIPL